MAATAPSDRTRAFMEAYGLRIPVLLAPMAGACPPALSVAVGRAGGMGACGALLMQPTEIAAWAQEVSAGTDGPFQMNLWIPDPPPARDPAAEAAVRAFLGQWGPEVPADAGDGAPPDFAAQCQTLLDARPAAISSIMGLYPADFIAAMKARGIRWFATATTVEEARVAERAGADVIVAQGMEVGGHRGAFEAASAEAAMVGLFALLPAIVDAVSVPVVATGGIADARGVAAALLLGASAVQIGTGFSTASSPPSRRRSIGRFSNRMLLPAGFRRSASPARFTNWRPGWVGGTGCRSGTSPPATAIPSAASTWNSCRASGSSTPTGSTTPTCPAR